MEKHVRTTFSELKFLLEGVECDKDTQMKAYDIIKQTAEAKMHSTPTEIKYRPNYYFVGGFGWHNYWKHGLYILWK